jgi:hypothetical protein
MHGLGAAWAELVLEAISAAYHGWPIFPANGASQGAGWVVQEVYVGIVFKQTKKNLMAHQNGVKLLYYS